MTFRNTISLLVTLISCLSPGHTFFDTFMYPCSSAMVCVDISKCDKVGMISNNDVVLTEAEELFRSPLVPCRRVDGEQGVCCRDPNYKDDWPTDVKFYDQKGKWNPKPTSAPFIGSDTKTTEVKVCTPPEVQLPNGRCGKPEIIVTGGSSFDSETITRKPTKAPQQYLPPVTEVPCPPGTKRGPKPGSCIPIVKTEVTTVRPATVKNVVKETPVAPVVKPETTTPRPSIVKETTQTPVVYLPPKSGSQVKQDAECGVNEVRLPNGECGVKVTTTKPPTTYLPPVKQHPCPPGTNKTPKGCEATIKIYKPKYEVKKVTPTTAKPAITKPTLPYMPDRTYLPPPPASQLKTDETVTISVPKKNVGQCSGKIFEENNKRYCCELML